MKRAGIRTFIAVTAVALLVSAAPVASAAPQSDRSYVGTWELAAWSVDGTTVDCPGTLPAPPPAPSLECSDGQFLKLTKNSRYTTNLSVFRSMKNPTGDYGVVKLANSPTRTIVFYSDAPRADPRAYNLKMRKDAEGRATMVISLELSVTPDKDSYVEMIFRPKTS